MDFIKKHFEKLLLAAGLIVLIGCAAFLAYRVTKLNEEIQDAPAKSMRKPKATVVPTDPTAYSNAITRLQVPSLWHTNDIDPFDTALHIPVSIIITTSTPRPPTAFPVTLNRVIRQPFKLMFLSYKQPGEDFAINFITRNRTFFVKKVGMEIADAFEKTGFFIIKFDQKTTNVFNKGLGVTNTLDVSELTIEKTNTPPILLQLGKVAQEREPIALLYCQTDNQEYRLRKDDKLTCGGKTYKVIDITPTQVLIEEIQSKEKHTISLPGVKE